MLVVMEVVPAGTCSPESMAALFAGGGWPAFIDADPVAAAALPRVRERFAQHELALLDDGEVLAAGWGVPLRWDGTVDDLPGGYSDALHRALTDADASAGAGACPTAFVLCAVQVRSDRSGRGLAAATLRALVDHASSRGLTRVIAPLRPTSKHRYPLTPIEQYAGWCRPDGAPFDPWLRLHLRLGAALLATSPASQTFTGTVAQWEEWSGLALPADGRYVVPDALAPLVVDREADTGTCVEPGIWVRHRWGRPRPAAR